MSESDIIREVEEDLQRERLERLWKQHGFKVIAAALLALLAVGGYQAWSHFKQSQNEAAGARLVAAYDLAREGKTAEAQTLLTGLAADAPDAYRILAKLRLAAADAAAGKAKDARAAYDAIAKDPATDPALREFAQIQAATLLVDEAEFTELENRLTALAADGSAWRHSARELLGLGAYKASKMDEAEKQFQLILGDPQTPPGLLQRAQMMLDVILARAGAAPPQPAATPAAAGAGAGAAAEKKN